MTAKGKGTITSLLPVAAMAAYLVLPVPGSLASASEIGCRYNGTCYGQGACIKNSCPAEQAQKCNAAMPDCNGSWSGCGSC